MHFLGDFRAVEEPSSRPSFMTQKPTATNTRVLQSNELFAGQRMLVIEHAGQRYRLLITRNERLILQK